MKRALLVASANFDADSDIPPLKFPGKDIAAIESVLQADDFGFDVRKLEDESSHVVLETLDEWVGSADYDDLLLIYFSGHGLLNRTRELFLSCRNTKTKTLNASGVKYKSIIELIEAHSARKVAIILDCCYAGKALAGGSRAVKGAVEEQVRTAVSEIGRGIFVLGASGSSQTAEEREVDGHGRLTKQIIDGLKNGEADIDNDGQISAKDLATYVKRELRRQNADQEPIEGGAFQGDLILGSNRRKQLLMSLAEIRKVLEINKQHFSRITYRRIEDYLDKIEKSQQIDITFSEDRYKALKNYSEVQQGGVELVIRAFVAAEAIVDQIERGDQPPQRVVSEIVSPPMAGVAVEEEPPEVSEPPKTTFWASKSKQDKIGLLVLFFGSVAGALALATSSPLPIIPAAAILAVCIIRIRNQ